MKNSPMNLAEKNEWVENYLAWLGDAHPDVSAQIAYVDILENGTINFVSLDPDE